MKRLFFHIIALFCITSCVIDKHGDYRVDAQRLKQHAESVKVEFNDVISRKFLNICTIDAYEALPEEEKSNPLYSSFKVTHIADNGAKFYDNFGYILSDDKRFGEVGAVWAFYDLYFICTEENKSWDFYFHEQAKEYQTMMYVPGKCRIWKEDDDNTYKYEFRLEEKGKNGYSSAFFSAEPVSFNISTLNRNGKYRFETYDPQGNLYDWVDIVESNSKIIEYKTSR